MNTIRMNHPALRNFDHLLESFMSEYPQSRKSQFNFPAVNISESENDFEVSMMVPGRKKEDFKISIDKDILTVSYDNKESAKDETKKMLKQEFVLKNFKRTFTIDDKINAEEILAKYEDGILLLTLPKKEEVKITPKEIAIS